MLCLWIERSGGVRCGFPPDQWVDGMQFQGKSQWVFVESDKTTDEYEV